MKNTAQLIVEPKVYAIFGPEPNFAAFNDWMDDEGVSDLYDTETPLGVLANAFEGAASDSTILDQLPEFAGRFCYKSWKMGRENAAYIENIMGEGHGSILEHANISFAVTGVSRSLTHELVRHRSGMAYSQESQRFVKPSEQRFVIPPLLLWAVSNDLEREEIQDWLDDQLHALNSASSWGAFFDDILRDEEKTDRMAKKRALEAARASLPNSCETKLVVTTNIRALRHILATRGAEAADLEIRRFAGALLREVTNRYGETNVLGDFEITKCQYGIDLLTAKHKKV